ncbi:hypothetical protein [Kitasatospora sp. NPDC001683]
MSRVQLRALWSALVLAVAFTGFGYVTTQARSLRAVSPWQGDPYDAVVSFTLFLVPALAGVTTVRARLCRGGGPQPEYRVDQLLRAARLGVALVAVTVATDATAAVLRAERELWDGRTAWLIAALLPLAAGAGWCLVLLRRAVRELPPQERRRPGGDWLDDLALLAAPLADLRALTRFLRRHIAAAAAGLSLLAAAAVVSGQTAGEGWPGVWLVLVELSVFASGFFAFCLLCDTLLRIAAPARPPGAARATAFAAALAVPVSGGLRAAVWSVVGLPGRVDSPVKLLVLMAGCAVLAGAVTLAAVRKRRTR